VPLVEPVDPAADGVVEASSVGDVSDADGSVVVPAVADGLGSVPVSSPVPASPAARRTTSTDLEGPAPRAFRPRTAKV
jgi:hypothetical protein